MIPFSQYLAESRIAPMYHGTILVNALKILETNSIITQKLQQSGATLNGTKAFYMSRDIRHSRWYAANSGNYNYLVFELDQQKLMNNYRIRPNNNWPNKTKKHMYLRGGTFSGNDESEEVIMTDKIDNFKKYITAIYIPEDTYTNWDNQSIISKIQNAITVPIYTFKNDKIERVKRSV